MTVLAQWNPYDGIIRMICLYCPGMVKISSMHCRITLSSIAAPAFTTFSQSKRPGTTHNAGTQSTCLKRKGLSSEKWLGIVCRRLLSYPDTRTIKVGRLSSSTDRLKPTNLIKSSQ